MTDKLKCSFCGRGENEVQKLVAGTGGGSTPSVYICDQCVGKATDIMEKADTEPTNGAGPWDESA